jgi:hypothetical protein
LKKKSDFFKTIEFKSPHKKLGGAYSNMQLRNTHLCGACGLRVPQNGQISVAHMVCMRHKKNSVKHALLYAPQNLSIYS